MKKQLTLGEFIFLLSRIELTNSVRFDFGGFHPHGIDSYRGYYEQLAIGFQESEEMTVEQLLKICREKVGATVNGYKGGSYDVGERTPLWVANWGRYHDTAIVGVIDDGCFAIIETAYQG